MPAPQVPRVALTLGAAALLLAGCSASAEDLRDEVEDSSGVLRVRVDENDGDNDIPFAHPPKHVRVTMESGASVEDVMAVFDAYDDAVDDEDLSGIEVVLDGSKKATLSSGEGIHVTEAMVDDLVGAQQDEAITEYRREAHPVLPGVRIVLASAGFDQVVGVADRYRDAPGVECVDVVSGRFTLIRDAVNDDLRITAAREELARRVDARWGLRGAVVSGRGPLKLVVGAADAASARQWVEGAALDEMVGRVVVRAVG